MLTRALSLGRPHAGGRARCADPQPSGRTRRRAPGVACTLVAPHPLLVQTPASLSPASPRASPAAKSFAGASLAALPLNNAFAVVAQPGDAVGAAQLAGAAPLLARDAANEPNWAQRLILAKLFGINIVLLAILCVLSPNSVERLLGWPPAVKLLISV